MKSQFLLILFFAITISLAAQDTRNDVEPVARLLQKELVKSGLPLMGINMQGRINNPGFQLSLLSTDQAIAFHLNDQPNDAFYIKAAGESIFIGSKSIAGLRNGVYRYLYNLGYRYYFPSEAWHVIPRLSTPYIPVEETGVPSFRYRRIWYAYGTGSKQADEDYKLWTEANLLGGEDINAGHSYEAIVNRNKAIFLEHPEFFAQKVSKGTIPKNPKFEVSNEFLVQLCIKDAFFQIDNYVRKTGQPPTSISMDPSDGGGFSTSKEALKIGGPSEQVFYLANRVAKATRLKYPSIIVGLYAYNLHSAPPDFSLEPNILVLIATAYNQSIYKTDQLIDLWKKKGIRVGIRDYFGVLAWDWDMPGQVRGSKIAYIKQIKDYHKNGILYFSAETNIGWISRGLGHYISSRLLWDVNSNIEELEAEFFQNMFGNANLVMQQLFKNWEQYRQPVPMDGNLLEWYNLVYQAEVVETNSAVQERLKQIKEYLYYVYLFKKWKEVGGDENLINLLNFAYRIQSSGVVSSYPLFRTLANSAVAGKQNMRYNDPGAKWKINNSIVSKEEINNKIRVARSTLVPVAKTINTIWPEKIKPEISKRASDIHDTTRPIKLRGIHHILFFLEEPEKTSINLSAGFINQIKPLVLRIFVYNSDLSTDDGALMLRKTIEPRQRVNYISLAALKPGAYLAVIDDAAGGFMVNFTGPIAYGIIADNQSKIWTLNRSNLFFDVKKNTKEYIIQTDGVLTLISPKGRIINLQGKHPATNIIEVRRGEEGIWQMKNQSGRLWIQGATPIVCPEETYLLRFVDKEDKF